jgi:hypothetical protein
MTSRDRSTIWIVGSGIRGTIQLTLEAIERLRAVEEVLFFPSGDLDADWLACVARVSCATDLSSDYLDGAVDTDNYARIVDRVVAAARSRGEVALLMPGHPRVGVTLTNLLEDESALPDIRVRAIEGVSSFDTMLNDLRRDPLLNASLVIDANRLLYYRYRIDPRTDCYVYHVCSIGTRRAHQRTPWRDNKLELLRDYLLGFYPRDHPAVLVQSGVGSGTEPLLHSGVVGELALLKSRLTFGTTLFVPGVTPAATEVDPSFAELLQ